MNLVGTKAPAMIHSKQAQEPVEILKKNEGNSYIVKTEDGVLCHAIYNGFTGLFYADDLFEVRTSIEEA